MSILTNIFPVAQIVISVILIIVVLLQQKGGGLGGVFGGGGGGASYHTKRGFEKALFTTTIVFGILFATTSLLALFI